MGKATKAQSNPYYIARIAASACNDAFGNREGAADTLGIERTRLARIELDTVTPYPDEVRVMADIYNAPELMTYHCWIPGLFLCSILQIKQFVSFS